MYLTGSKKLICLTKKMDDLSQVTMETKDGDLEDEDKLWNITEKLVEKFYNLGKECIFLSVDEEDLQCRCTKMGNKFLASRPKWSKVFRDFCVNFYSTGFTSEQDNVIDNGDNDVDDNIETTEKDEVDTSGDKTKFTSIRSGRSKRNVTVLPENKVKSSVSKDLSDAAIETGTKRTSKRLKDKNIVAADTRLRYKTRNKLKRSDEILVRNKTLKSNKRLPRKGRKINASAHKKDNVMTESNSESLKGDNKVLKLEVNGLDRKSNQLRDKGSNSECLTKESEICTQERLEVVKDGSLLESNDISKARQNEEARYQTLTPDLKELWQYLHKIYFTCKICSKVYDNTISYYNHIRSHKDFQHCKICDVFIPKEDGGMEKHKAEKHSDGLLFQCIKCDQRYKSRLGLKNHFICHHAGPVDQFKCQICGTQCGNLSMLTRHGRIHDFENSCFICLKKIDTKENLKQHMKEVHGYYLCTTCSLYFVDHVVLEEHELTHLNETDSASNTTSLVDILDTNSTSGTENENTSKERENELNISDTVLHSSENTQEGFLTEQSTEEKAIKLDLDHVNKMFITEITDNTKEENLQSTESNENERSSETEKSTNASEIQISTKAGEKHCKFCGKVFKQIHALLRHMKLHNNRAGFSCEHCGKICKTDETFKRHMLLHLPNNEKPFVCEICGKGFPTRTNLKIHHVVHNEQNSLICEYCGKGFKSPKQLKIHNRSHTGEEPYQCTVCNKRFRGWDMLDRHKITHKPKSVICDICGKLFADRLQLHAHKKSHDKVGRYICIFDKSRFKSAGTLRSHYVVKHLAYAKEKGWLMYQCEHCERILGSKEKYRRHVRTHTGEKPYRCTICGKSFTENGNLNAHMKIHNNDKPHKCTICNKSFIQRRTLKKHILIHEQPAVSSQEKLNEDNSGYTKDQLLALSIVAGSQNYMLETKPVTEKKSIETTDNQYVVILPETQVFQPVSEQNFERTPLFPVQLSDTVSGNPKQVPTLSMNFNEQDCMAINQHLDQITQKQFIHSSSKSPAQQSKIPIEPVQLAPKIGNISEQQFQPNKQFFIDPVSYTEHILTTSSAF